MPCSLSKVIKFKMASLQKLLFRYKWISSLTGPVSYRVLIALCFQKKEKKSIIFFTQHKSASTFVARILSTIGKTKKGLKHVNYPNLISDLGCYFNFGNRFKNEGDWYYQNSEKLFKNNGYIYGPHRAPFFIPSLELFKKIIFLRDPRDSLISRYYSFGFTHGIPQDSTGKSVFLEERMKINNESIDSYCLRMAHEWCKPLLSSYKKIIQSSLETPLLLTYEEFASDPLNAVNEIFSYCGINDDKNNIAYNLAITANPVQDKIKDSEHQRSGKVGQYINELEDSTIKQIDIILKEELLYFKWKSYSE